jgi:kanosamine 6-kinase
MPFRTIVLTQKDDMACNLLALDLGATKLAVRLRGTGGATDFVFPLARTGSGKDEIQSALGSIRSVLSGTSIQACGLACAPTLDGAGKVVRWPSRPHWGGISLLDELQEVIGCAVDFTDDGNAAALAEAEATANSTMVYLGLGTGVGGGVVLSRSLLDAASGLAGEIGHMIVNRDGPKCECGRHGCLQAYASASAILRKGLPGGAGTGDPLLVYRERYLRGDSTAIESLDMAGWALAQTAVSLSELLGISIFVIGGSVGCYVPEIVTVTAERVSTLLRSGQPPLQIKKAVHGAMSSLAGAEILAQRRLRHAQAQEPKASADGREF